MAIVTPITRGKVAAEAAQLDLTLRDFPRQIRPEDASQPEAVDVSILIVTWNSASWIGRCLRALPQACGELRYEVIVHDNASRDTTSSIVRAFDAPWLGFESSENHGFAAGSNSALRRATGRFVFYLNPDCEPAPNSIAKLVDYLDHNSAASAAVPLLMDEQGIPQREFQLRRFPTLKSLAADILLLDHLFPSNQASFLYRYRDVDISRVQTIEQPAAAALMVRRDVLDRVGAFDEQFAPAWFEDVDFCKRLWTQGGAIHLVPDSVTTHRGGASLDHVPYDQFLGVWYRNLYLYAQKWLEPAEVQILRWTIVVGALIRAVATAVGLSSVRTSRFRAVRAYLQVSRDALRKWDDRSPSF